ncbi:hypothetical protein BACPU_26020 [Bacillus pumilus]|nr:hypothetical protein BACPU_26020 [Bacillus pumilus]
MLLKIFILMFILLVWWFLILTIRNVIDLSLAEKFTREEDIKIDSVSKALANLCFSGYGLYKLITTNSIKEAVIILAVIVITRENFLKFYKSTFKKFFGR